MMPRSSPAAKLCVSPAANPGQVSTALHVLSHNSSTPRVGSALETVSWCIMNVPLRSHRAYALHLPAKQPKVHFLITPCFSAPSILPGAGLQFSPHGLVGFPGVGVWRAGISSSTATKTMADSKTSSQSWMSDSPQQVLVFGILWPWIILHYKHVVMLLGRVLTVL